MSHMPKLQLRLEIVNQIVKVLGLNWDTASDEFFFDLSDLCNYGSSLSATKRSVLKLTAKIFDPIGFLTPFTIEMKILFQTYASKESTGMENYKEICSSFGRHYLTN